MQYFIMLFYVIKNLISKYQYIKVFNLVANTGVDKE